MHTNYLNDEQIEQFLTRGHIVLHDCFSPDFARDWTQKAFVRLGYDPNDKSTWINPRIHMPGENTVEVRDFAPDAWAAMCDLCGGEERVAQPYKWSDAFICNFGIGADKPWQAPSPQVPGWHKDGDFFRHFLDSPEQGLLTLVVWSDVIHQGGATFVACDSVPVVARFLAQHPEGLGPHQFDFRDLIGQCHDFIEVTGKPGDVVLLHPYVLHASSQNVRGVARFITNPPIHLKQPMNFNRDNAGDFSPIEQSVLRGLEVERLDFAPQAPRERFTPERVKQEHKMAAEQKARLAAANG